MIRLLYLLAVPCWLLIAGLQSAAASADPAPLRAGEQHRRLDASIAMLRDPGRQMRIEDVLAPAAQQNFTPLDNGLSLGFSSDVVWLRLPLRRAADAPADWWLEASNAVIDELRLYAPDAAGRLLEVQRTGDRSPFAERPVAFRHPVFPLFLPDDRTRVFYLRIETSSALLLALDLWQPAALQAAAAQQMLAIGLVVGLLLTTALINLFTGVIMRDPRYLIFAGSCLFFIEALLVFLGLGAEYLFPRAPAFADALNSFNVCLLPAVILYYMRGALRLHEFFPRLDTVLRWVSFACLAAVLSIPLDSFRSIGPLLHLLTLAATLGVAWAAWQSVRARRRGALILFAATLLFAAPVVLAALSVLGFIAGAAWMETGWMISLAIYCVLLHLRLLTELLAIREERLQAANSTRHNREMIEQERRLREEQTVYFSYVAHELRNPLGVVVSGLGNLRASLAEADFDVQRRVARISGAARRMGELIDRHLRLQRLSRVEFEADFNDYSPGFPAREAHQLIGDAYPDRVIEHVEAGDLPEQMVIDADLVTLALVNLLDNAVKYSPPGSPIRLEVQCDSSHPGHVVFRVSDRGQGIADADRERLFGIYARERASGSSGDGGFGIGLALVAHVARHHGGSVVCTSQPGQGSCFELRLPIRAADVMATA